MAIPATGFEPATVKTSVFTRSRFGVSQRREKSTKYFSREQAEEALTISSRRSHDIDTIYVKLYSVFIMTINPLPQRSPEVSLSSSEGGEGEDFNELLQGMLDLTSLEGNVTALDFIERTLQEMDKMGVMPNDYRIGLILQHAFGSRDSVLEKVEDMSIADFEKTYPGRIGDLVKWYIVPLLGRES